ncbi:MAG: CoA transferase [Chloroflexi bacterium]|nr:CoA transferase [Chloroflexota bacterium]
MKGLLKGLNILDCGRAAVGPWGVSLLGAMGANVIRVESPEGDAMFKQMPLQRGYAVAYTVWNANKKGIILDLKSPDARPHLRRLVEQADVIMENLTPETMGRLGLGYEEAKAINPRIVYASSPGWGTSGPMKDLAAGDPDFQAFSGFVSLNGEEGGKMEMFRFSYPLDLHAATLFASSALLGVLARGRTGRSQHTVSSHLGCSLFMNMSRGAEYVVTGQVPRPLGNASASTAPHEAFLCQDQRYLAIGVDNDGQWRALCKALGRQDLLEDPRWSNNRARVQGRKELSRELARTLLARPARWWAIQLEKNGVPFGYFYDFETLRNHRQVTDNQFIVETDVSYQGHMFLGGVPWRFANSETRLEPGPRHGEHTAEILDRGFGVFGQNGARKGSPRTAGGPSAADDGPPLAGIRVIDVSQGLAGPYLSLLLADAGAEVIKVEPPEGDYGRAFAPASKTGDSAPFLLLNRNKKSVVLDPRTPEGREKLRRLILTADIFVEDWGVGKAEAMGLGYKDLAREKPGLVYCAITAFGEEGPFRNRPGSELVAQAYSECWLSLGALNGAPLRTGSDMASTGTGAMGFLGVLAALVRRQKTGQGERVAVSLLGTLICYRQANWTSLGDPDDWIGGFAEPYGGRRSFGHATRDQRLFIHARRGNRDVDAIMSGIRERVGNRGREEGEVLSGTMRLPIPEYYFADLPSQEVKSILDAAGAIGVEINNVKEILEHPQAAATGVLKVMEHPALGHLRVFAKPWQGSWQDPDLAPSPALDQHNREVLKELAGERPQPLVEPPVPA